MVGIADGINEEDGTAVGVLESNKDGVDDGIVDGNGSPISNTIA